MYCLCTERKTSLSDLRRGRNSTANKKPTEQRNPERERELKEEDVYQSVTVTPVNYLGPSWSKLDHGHCARAGFPPLKIFKIWVTG